MDQSLSIEARKLFKKFPTAKEAAVNELELLVSPGEAVAFLGPNGAGKSTTIKMLCGILRPDRGFSKIMGHLSGSKEANRLLGLVFGARSQLYFHMTVEQCLSLQAETYFVPWNEQENRIGTLLESFSASHLRQKRVRELSLGERMRCEIVASLLHKPKVILLDEPTIGLDIHAKANLRDSLRELQKRERTTMLLTSHDLSDVEALCDRCILIDKGAKNYDGALKNVKGPLAPIRRITIFLKEKMKSPSHSLPGMQELESAHSHEKLYELNVDQSPLPKVLSFLSESFGENLYDIKIAEVSLEEVIRQQFKNHVLS